MWIKSIQFVAFTLLLEYNKRKTKGTIMLFAKSIVFIQSKRMSLSDID